MDEPEPVVVEEVAEEGEEVVVEAGAEDVGEEDETDAEIEAMKKRVKEMEEEAAKIEALQTTVEKSMKASGAPPSGPAVDARSIYVGQVDYATTNDELKEFFKSCGTVNRVTIGMNKFTGEPKG
jgi:polyadenylate-binding protein 2